MIEIDYAELMEEKGNKYYPQVGDDVIMDFYYSENNITNGIRTNLIHVEKIGNDDINDHSNSFWSLRKIEPIWFWTTLIVPIIVILLVIFTIVKLRKMKKDQKKKEDEKLTDRKPAKVIYHGRERHQ